MFVRQLRTKVQIRRTKVEHRMHMANAQRQFHRKYPKISANCTFSSGRNRLLHYSIYKRKITDRLLRVGTTIRMHESFVSSPRKYVWAKPAMKRNTTKQKDCEGLQKCSSLRTVTSEHNISGCTLLPNDKLPP